MNSLVGRLGTLALAAALVLPAGAPACSQAPPADALERKISLNLTEVPLRRAIEVAFTGSGLQYFVEPNVPNVPVTLNIRDVPVPTAIRLVIRQAAVLAPGLTLSKDNDVYAIRIRVAPRAVDPPAPPQGDDPPADYAAEKIPVQFQRAAQIVTQIVPDLLPAGIVSLTPIGADNSLIARGTPEAIERLQRLVRLTDIPTRMLSISVGVTGPGPGGRPLKFQSGARTLSGTDVTIDEQTGPGAEGARVKVTVKPLVQGDGTLLMDSDWDLSIPVHGGAKGPIRLVKRLRTSARVMSGRGSAIGEVDLGPWGGKGVVRLWLRATILKHETE